VKANGLFKQKKLLELATQVFQKAKAQIH
jgi:hypothetical protein